MSKCPVCGKTVFFAERQNKDGKDYHVICLKLQLKSQYANGKGANPYANTPLSPKKTIVHTEVSEKVVKKPTPAEVAEKVVKKPTLTEVPEKPVSIPKTAPTQLTQKLPSKPSSIKKAAPTIQTVTSAAPVPKVEISAGESRGLRDYMEDRHVALLEVPNYSKYMYLGVYDGHEGTHCCDYLKEKLHVNIFNDPGLMTTPEQSLINTFISTDRDFLIICESKLWEGGSTAISVVITDTHYYVANTGDCRCVLAKSSGVLPLSVDQKPYLPKEKERIIASGATVLDGRINGELAVARAFGDNSFKQNLDVDADKQAVIALPEITATPKSSDDQFLIVACDGLWDVMTSEEAVEFVRNAMSSGKRSEVAQKLVDESINVLRSSDNVTAVVLFLK